MNALMGEINRDHRLISIQLEMWVNQSLAGKGITGVQAQLLLEIPANRTGTSLTELHRLSGYSMASLSSLIKKLRDKGHIRVESCPWDERRKLLFGTEQGLRIRESADCAIREIQGRLYAGFSDEELRLHTRLQKKMRKNLSVLSQGGDREVPNL